MKRLPQADVAFNKLTDSGLLVRTQAIHDGLTGNATFPTPTITLASYQAFIDSYAAALSAAVKGSKADTAAKDNAKAILINNTRSICSYVNQVIQDLYASATPGNFTGYDFFRRLILSTGFTLSKAVARQGPLSVLRILESRSLTSGQLYIRVSRVPGAKAFLVQTQSLEVPGEPVLGTTYSNSRITVVGLVNGFGVRFRVAAIGPGIEPVFTSWQERIIL